MQVAILTERITNLTQHFQSHKKDNHSKTGLMRMINQRRESVSIYQKNKQRIL